MPAAPAPGAKKLAGLPPKAWALAIGGGLVVGFVFLRKKSSDQAAAAETPGASTQGSADQGQQGQGGVTAPLDPTSSLMQSLGLSSTNLPAQKGAGGGGGGGGGGDSSDSGGGAPTTTSSLAAIVGSGLPSYVTTYQGSALGGFQSPAPTSLTLAPPPTSGLAVGGRNVAS